MSVKITEGLPKKTAGRPSIIDGEHRRRVNVAMGSQTYDWSGEIGDGNRSEGIRIAVEYYYRTVFSKF